MSTERDTPPRVSDAKLDDWYRRWPSTLPTSVPHEQVRMLIEDLRDSRAEVAALRARLEAAERELGDWAPAIADNGTLRSANDAMQAKLDERTRAVATLTAALRDVFEITEREIAMHLGRDGKPHNAKAQDAIHALRTLTCKLTPPWRVLQAATAAPPAAMPPEVTPE